MLDDRKEMASFLIEELKENWFYIRHIEEIRLKHTHIFLIITGAIISVFSLFLTKPSETSSFIDLITRYGVLIIAGSGFIFLYGFFLCIFLAHQKRGYEHYRIVNAEIRNWFIKYYGKQDQFSFEKKLPFERTARQVMTSTFFYWYLLVVLINVFAFMVLSVTSLGLIASSWSLKCDIILSAFLSVCILVIECYLFVRCTRKIKPPFSNFFYSFFSTIIFKFLNA